LNGIITFYERWNLKTDKQATLKKVIIIRFH